MTEGQRVKIGHILDLESPSWDLGLPKEEDGITPDQVLSLRPQPVIPWPSDSWQAESKLHQPLPPANEALRVQVQGPSPRHWTAFVRNTPTSWFKTASDPFLFPWGLPLTSWNEQPTSNQDHLCVPRCPNLRFPKATAQ